MLMAAMRNRGDLLRPLSALCVTGCRLTAVEAAVVSLALWRVRVLLISHLNDRTDIF